MPGGVTDLSLSHVHGILARMSRTGKEPGEEEDGDAENVFGRQSKQVQAAVSIGTSLWGHEAQAWGSAQMDMSGFIASRAPDAAPGTTAKPRRERKPSAYAQYNKKTADVWFARLRAGPEVPNTEQMALLRAVASRCADEAAEERSRKVNKTYSEPLRGSVEGVPGAGKSKSIKWICTFFTECLGWESGCEFACLAPQNTQAALIGGFTIHSFGAVPINAEAGKRKREKAWAEQNVDALFLRAQSLRWLILDEISSAAAEVLGALDSNLRGARQRQLYARRPDGSPRPFGGVNLLGCGDWWQFPPVRATAIMSNPFKHGLDATAERILSMFWTKDEDSVTKLFELVQEVRCEDPWLSYVLNS